MPRRRKTPIKDAATIAPADGAAPIATPAAPETTDVATIVNLICAYTNYTKAEAHNLVSGVISVSERSLVNDVIDWCVHIKTLENAQRLVMQVALGHALVEKQAGQWVLVDRVGDR